jgi:glutamate N-acetyltransferase/amino-acid N-acetyltransferase
MDFPIPEGFELAGVHCGIKKKTSREDLTLIHCRQPAVGVGVYTQNRFFAAPVAVDRERTPSDSIRAVVVNSGNANACTGERGRQDAESMTRLTADALGLAADQVLVMSTGIIGHYLPMDRIARGIESAAGRLGRSPDSLASAARGMLTTDNGPKVVSRTVELDDGPLQLLGLAKGAAMIGPRMATMLAVFLTDAALSTDDAQASLAQAVEHSFHCISVEGHMSTNDTVLLLAAGTRRTDGSEEKRALSGAQLAGFQQALRETAVELARMIPNDGEGSTHLIEIAVSGCRCRDDAFRIAQTVASSALVKTAITGGDPNWGRIVSAAGYAGVNFDPHRVDLHLNGNLIFQQGSPVEFDEAAVSRGIREQRETKIQLTFGEGTAEARFWTSDLTVEYVRFNAEYST